MWINYQNLVIYLLTCIFILLIIFIIVYIIKYNFDYSYYKLLFLYYYNIETEQIYYLHKTILEFNFDNINIYEHIKNNDNLSDNDENINKTLLNLNRENNIYNNIKNKKKNNNSKRASYKGKEEEEENNKIKNNNINGSILNKSMNGSSIQFLNNSNFNKIQINKNIDNNNTYIPKVEEEQNKISQEESVDSLLKISNKILPNCIRISLFLILTISIIYLILSYANISEVFNENLIWKNSIYLSMNILERIPKLMELVIFACVNVISNNKRKNILNKVNQLKYLTYFKANSLYYSEDIINKYFQNNYFGELLKDNFRLNYNLNNYLFQEEHNIFKNTKDMEIKLNIEGMFCIYSVIGDVLSTNEKLSIYEFFKKVEDNALNCKFQNLGINESGSRLEITYILQEITNRYIEFITYNTSNINLNQAIDNFFTSSDIKRIFRDIQYPLVFYFNSIIYTVNLDFNIQNNLIMNRQNLYTFFLFLINLLIIICLLFSNRKGEKNKKSFCYFSQIPKANNN